MNLFAASPPAPIARIRDLVEIGKPRLSLLVIFGYSLIYLPILITVLALDTPR